jgi:hypothetical protein
VRCSLWNDFGVSGACLFTRYYFCPEFTDYRYENEHRDLRRVMGAGIAITRGAAAALSFCFSIVLLTVCRNLLTLLRETFVAHYIPLDAAIVFHKIVAITGGVFARESRIRIGRHASLCSHPHSRPLH